MISGYLPYLIHLVVLIGLWGSIGAVDGWRRAIKTAEGNLKQSTLLGFLGGCAKGIGVLAMFTLVVPLLLDWVQTK